MFKFLVSAILILMNSFEKIEINFIHSIKLLNSHNCVRMYEKMHKQWPFLRITCACMDAALFYSLQQLSKSSIQNVFFMFPDNRRLKPKTICFHFKFSIEKRAMWIFNRHHCMTCILPVESASSSSTLSSCWRQTLTLYAYSINYCGGCCSFFII